MVVVAPVAKHLTHTEERLQLVKARRATRTLRDHELVTHLVAGLVAVSEAPAVLADEPDREASFSVYKANDPACTDQPFLLIFRTVQIVTAHHLSVGRVPDGYTGFPAYSRMQPTLLPAWWATNLP